MSSSHCTDNITLNDFNLILNNPSLSNQGSNHMIKRDMCKPSTTSSTIKVISINCCSLRSSSRRSRLSGLIHEHEPDIIVGCESHLDNSYLSSEIFPAGFNIYRKDRTAG